MPTATKQPTEQQCISDLKRLQQDYPDKYISRNFYREWGSYSETQWSRYFGTYPMFRRAAGLDLNLNQQKLLREVARHSNLDHYRKFYDTSVSPWLGLYERPKTKNRFKTVLVGSDFHDLDTDPFTLGVFIDIAKRVQPDYLCLNGDIHDMYEFSRYDKDPRKVQIKERFDFVKREIYAPLREACPNSQIDLNLGNHEWRILKLLADATPHVMVLLSDVLGLTLDDVFCVREYEINLHCKWDLSVQTKTQIKEQLRRNYIVYEDSFVCAHIKDYGFGMAGTSGHIHKPDVYPDRNIKNGRYLWTVTGCICKTDADYIEGFDRAMNGFGLFHIDTLKGSVYHEPIIIPGDFAVVGGNYYTRK